MSTPFKDDDKRSYWERDEANKKRANICLVRHAVAADQHTEAVLGDDDGRIAKLATEIAEGTDGLNFIVAELDNRPELRAFVDAVIGATGGSDDFVEITDKELAARLGRSTKTVQDYRVKFREIDNHTLLIEIKDNWRHPDTHVSHPHAYKCKVTALAAEALQNAKLSPLWSGDTKARVKVMKEAAETVTKGLSLGKPRSSKKRKQKTDAEKVDLKLAQVAALLDEIASLRSMVKNPDFARVWESCQKVDDSFNRVRQAYDFEGAISMQDQEKKDGNAPGDVSVAEVVETQVEAGQVEKTSTCNDSTESTTCENHEFFDAPVKVPEIPPDAEHTCPSPPVEPELIEERVFIMCEAGDVAEVKAARIARRDLCETCRTRTSDDNLEAESWPP
jgi:hypothetical protein